MNCSSMIMVSSYLATMIVGLLPLQAEFIFLPPKPRLSLYRERDKRTFHIFTLTHIKFLYSPVLCAEIITVRGLMLKELIEISIVLNHN